MAVSLVIPSSVEAEIEAISDYISRDNPAAAVRWVGAIRARCHALTDMPFSGRRHGPRFRVVREGRYLIVYLAEPRERPERIIVVAVFHSARDIYRLFPVG